MNENTSSGRGQNTESMDVVASVRDTLAIQDMELEEEFQQSRFSDSSDDEGGIEDEDEEEEGERPESEAEAEAEEEPNAEGERKEEEKKKAEEEKEAELTPKMARIIAANEECKRVALERDYPAIKSAVQGYEEDIIVPWGQTEIVPYPRGGMGCKAVNSGINPYAPDQPTLFNPARTASIHRDLLDMSSGLLSIDLTEDCHASKETSASPVRCSTPEPAVAFIEAAADNVQLGAEQKDSSIEKQWDWTGMKTEPRSSRPDDRSGLAQDYLKRQRSMLQFDLEKRNIERPLHKRCLPLTGGITSFKLLEPDQHAALSRALLHVCYMKLEAAEADRSYLQREVDVALPIIKQAEKDIAVLQASCEDALDEVQKLRDADKQQKDEFERLEAHTNQQGEQLARISQRFISAMNKLQEQTDRCQKLQEHVDSLEHRNSFVESRMGSIGQICVQPEQLVIAKETQQSLERSKAIQDQYEELQEVLDRLKTRNRELEAEIEALKRERFDMYSAPTTASTSSGKWPRVTALSGAAGYAPSSSAKLGAAPSVDSEQLEDICARPLPQQPTARPTTSSTSASSLVRQIQGSRGSRQTLTKEYQASADDSYNALPPPLPAAGTAVKLGFAPQAAHSRDFEPAQPLAWQKRVKKWRRTQRWNEHRESLRKLREQEDQEQADYELLQQRAFEKQFGCSLVDGTRSSKQDRLRFFHDVLSRPEPSGMSTLPVLSAAA